MYCFILLKYFPAGTEADKSYGSFHMFNQIRKDSPNMVTGHTVIKNEEECPISSLKMNIGTMNYFSLSSTK